MNKGTWTHSWWGEGMQLPYWLHRGQLLKIDRWLVTSALIWYGARLVIRLVIIHSPLEVLEVTASISPL